MSTINKSQFWLEHITQARQSKLSLAAYARQHKLSDKSIYWWKRELIKRGELVETETATQFIKLSATQVAQSDRHNQSPSSFDSCIRIRFSNGHCLEIPVNGCDFNQLLQKVSLL